MLNWLKKRIQGESSSAELARLVADSRPAWIDELLESTQKQARTAAKQSLRVETMLTELGETIEKLRASVDSAAASRDAPPPRCTEIFDALDALDAARTMASEPNLVEGLTRVQQKLSRFCEQHGYTRVAPVGEEPDGRIVRIVGTETSVTIPPGRITKIVRAAILSAHEIVREGEVLISKENG